MKDVRKEASFLYTQSSLGTFNACPYKFKLKYLLNLYWSEDEEQAESFRRGNEFHLLAERYYMGMGDLALLGADEEMVSKIEMLKEKHPLKEGWKYYPEFEIRYNTEGIRLLGRYDLIVVKPQNKLQIIDFKTNKKKLDKDILEEGLQTKIYLFLLWENFNLILENARKIKNLEMIYYQTEYPEEPITIKYTDDNHQKNRDELKKMINFLESFDMENLEKQRVKHCMVCEFEKICWKA